MPAPEDHAAIGSQDDPAPVRGGRAVEAIAGLLSIVWVIAVLAYLLVSPPGDDVQTLGLVMTLLVVFLPLR